MLSSLYSQHSLLLFSFYCTKSTQARPDHTPDAFYERKIKSEDTNVDISSNADSDVVGSTPERESKPELKAETDVGVLPEMRATHVKGFLSRGLQASCPGESVVCVDGMMAGDVTCQVACAGECCIGEYSFFTGAGPCTGFNGTLCKDIDTPPCSGRRACTNANIDLVVQGCNAYGACQNANIRSVDQGCNDQFACFSADIDTVVQGCNGDNACRNANIESVDQGCNAGNAISRMQWR